MRKPRMSLACFDPLMDTVDLMSLPPLPDTPPPRTSLLPVDVDQERSAQELAGHGKLVDVVTPMPLQRTMQRNTPRSNHQSSEGFGAVGQSKVLMEDGTAQGELASVEPLRIIAEEDERRKTMTPRPGGTIAHSAETESTAPADTRSLPPSRSTNSALTDRSPRISAPSRQGTNNILASMTTKITGLDDSTSTDLMSDDMSFLRAMRSPSDTLSGSPPSRRISPSSSHAEDRVPPVNDENHTMTPRKQAFSVLAGMAAFEASHAARGGSAAAPQLVVHSPDDASPASVRVRGVEVRESGWLKAEGQEGEVSTVLPASPSIKRYLASALQVDGNVGRTSMRPAHEESRLDLMDLDDLRFTELDPRLADATIQERNDPFDHSTIYPSSPAVRRNMMRMDGEELMAGELSLLDPRLGRSVLRVPPRDSGPTPEMARPTDSAVTRSPTKRNLALVQDAGDQTMDLGALIKKTSRKLTSDCADVTVLAPGLRTRGAKPTHDMSMLMDMQSPFRTREGEEESYYDLLDGDNTFMQQVEQVEAEDDSPVKGNVLPPAISTGRVTRPENANDLVFKVPALPRNVASATGSNRPEASLNRINSEPLQRAAIVKPAPTQNFEFKVPELPRNMSSAEKASSGSVQREASPSRESRQLSLSSARLLSPERSATRSRGATRTAPRTMFTPVARQAEPERTPHKRNPNSKYRSTTLPPRTPLAERGFGPQSAKKASTSSLSGVLEETAGRSLNTRLTSASGGSAIKRSATMNDFAPGEARDRDEKTPVRRHLRAPSDSIVQSGSSTLLDIQSRKTALSPAGTTKLEPAAGTTSRIRLPGKGLRQVSGQGKVDDADARSRKQATSPEKLLAAGKARVSLVPKPKSPPRQRTGFRPVAGQQSAPARIVDRPLVTAPARQSVAPRQPVSRTGSSSSTILGRTSTIPSTSRISTATTRPLTSATGSTTRMLAPSATMPVKASNGLPRPTSRIAPSGTARTGSTTSVSSASRLTRPSMSKDRQGTLSTVETSFAPLRKPLTVGAPEDAVRSRLDRFKPTRK